MEPDRTAWAFNFGGTGGGRSMERRDKENYYLDIAQTVMERSTCCRGHYGAIIVRNDEIIATGYNGAPRGRINCTDLGYCIRRKLNVPSGERYELCRSVHAEANAIISAARSECIGGTMYLVGRDSCRMCRMMMINAGLSRLVVRNTPEKYTVYNVADWVFDDDSILEPDFEL